MLAPLPLVAKTHQLPSSSAMIMGSGTLLSITGLVKPTGPPVAEPFPGAGSAGVGEQAEPAAPTMIIAVISCRRVVVGTRGDLLVEWLGQRNPEDGVRHR
ncbi:hypothetical protein GCM10022204_38430 [Microlunatus aurantiacus]|uniref:Secreted protein n=1 Tax=Microlunatus aurantiacus TaxID=446786 RepID=A0ABP7E8F4_9ACTN